MKLESELSIGIIFDGVSSIDLGLETLVDRSIGLPNRRPITVPLPYSNKVLDLSSYYEETLFEERTLQYDFQLPWFDSKIALNDFFGRLQRWLYKTNGKVPLVDGADPTHYYLAEVVNAPTRDEMLTTGNITVSFTAYPFRIERAAAGDDNWDTFDFENGIAQSTVFKVTDNKAITLINISQTEIIPAIKSSSPMTISDGTTSYDFAAGEDDQANAAYQLTLKVGANQFLISGTGTAEFIWHNEVI